jgi:HEPN domain-containing protein
MAHFKLYSVDEEEMWTRSSATFEYICGKKEGEDTYTRFSGIFGGFDQFNLRCEEPQDYLRAEWIIDELNILYKNKDYKDKRELEPIVNRLIKDSHKEENMNIQRRRRADIESRKIAEKNRKAREWFNKNKKIIVRKRLKRILEYMDKCVGG